jgi:two-component system LytT family response regulator
MIRIAFPGYPDAGLTGFDLLKRINKYSFEVIFTTAFDKYAIEAIRFSALDFLLKPIDADELKAAVHRFMEKKASAEERERIMDNLRFNLGAQKNEFRLADHDPERHVLLFD